MRPSQAAHEPMSGCCKAKGECGWLILIVRPKRLEGCAHIQQFAHAPREAGRSRKKEYHADFGAAWVLALHCVAHVHDESFSGGLHLVESLGRPNKFPTAQRRGLAGFLARLGSLSIGLHDFSRRYSPRRG